MENKKIKGYIIPIECYTTVRVMAENLEEAISNLSNNDIDDYESTFSDWTVDHSGTVTIVHLDEEGEEEDLCLDELSRADYDKH